MRIVHIITRLIVGGAQENTLLSCQGQHAAGHQVTLISGPPLGPEGSLLPSAQAGGYRVEILGPMRRAILPGKDLASYGRLVQRLRELRPDVVHTHSSKAGIIGRWAAHAAGVPAIVHTVHGLAFTASRSAIVNLGYRVAEQVTAPITSAIVCVADAMTRQSLATHVGRPWQYVTIYSGMDTQPFVQPPVAPAVVRASLGLNDSHMVVGTIARLFDLKGHDDLLELAPALCQRFPQLRFLWVGDGLLRPRFERHISQLGLHNRFILTGLVPPQRIAELANVMDLLVHPSRREGLARAVVQGQLAAKPVVAYDIDGNREGLLHGTSGFVLPPFDRRQLNDALMVLLNDVGLRQRMGQAGRQFALDRFGAATMVSALQRLYELLLSGRFRHRGS